MLMVSAGSESGLRVTARAITRVTSAALSSSSTTRPVRDGKFLVVKSVVGVLPANVTTWKVSPEAGDTFQVETLDRKSTRLNSSHANISYAVFCLKKKKKKENKITKKK